MVNTTLKKISEVLGISISTVSRALKDHPDISANTKRKVVELATALDYEPNVNAINLRTKNSKVFGLLVPTVSNTFYDSFMSAVEEESRKNGYSILIMQSNDDADTEQTILKIFKQNRVTGLFACITPNTKDFTGYDKLNELSIPVVFFDKVPDHDQYIKVCLADEEAAIQAARVLISKKKKRILTIFGNLNLSITKTRLRAFKKAFEKYKSIQIFIEHANTPLEATVITSRYFSAPEKPDAIFCMSDEILMGAMKALQQLNISYPAQTGVIALSNGLFPQLYYPEITYVETSGYKLGKTAFGRMIAAINGSNPPEETLLEPVLISGHSI